MNLSEFAAEAAVPSVADTGALNYQHVDVFTKQPLSGNGLNVFLNKQRLTVQANITLDTYKGLGIAFGNVNFTCVPNSNFDENSILPPSSLVN